MTVCVMHGIVHSRIREKQSFRNYVGREAFEFHLRNRSSPYSDWGNDSQLDVLTIDDATQAGAEACFLARRLGHQVIFFINPFQIASGEPYFINLLEAYIDDRQVQRVTVNKRTWDLHDQRTVRLFRNSMKEYLMKKSASEAMDNTKQIGLLLQATDVKLPEHARPLKHIDIRRLKEAGVRIESHGWSHDDISALSDASFRTHVVSAHNWLKAELSVSSTLYAVPYGLTDLSHERQLLIEDAYFLVDKNKPIGQLGPKCYNRKDITSQLQAVEI